MIVCITGITLQQQRRLKGTKNTFTLTPQP